MSNKRNQRRGGQRVRSEVDRKPKRITKATVVSFVMLPAERARKERERRYKHPTKKERRERELRTRRWRVSGKPTKQRKPRTKYGRTFWNHSLDV